MEYSTQRLYKRTSTHELVYIDEFISRSKNYRIYVSSLDSINRFVMCCTEHKFNKARLDSCNLLEVFDTELTEKFKKLFIERQEREISTINSKLSSELYNLKDIKTSLINLENLKES